MVLLEQETWSSYRKREVWLFISDSVLDVTQVTGICVRYAVRGANE